MSRHIGTELEQHGHAAGFGAVTLSKPPIFRAKGAKSWPVLPLRRRDFWVILLTCILFCIFLFSRAKGGILTNYLFQFARILAFCFLGEICHAVLPLPIPASIYGLVLMLIGLQTGILPLSAVNEAGGFLIEIMPMLFIPAGVGLMVSWGALKPVIIPISIIIVVTTILVMAVSGRIAQFILKKEDKKHE